MTYIPGSENVVADALSRIYSNDASGTVRAHCEYTYHDVVDDDTTQVEHAEELIPVLAGIEAHIATQLEPRTGGLLRRLSWPRNLPRRLHL